MDEKVNWQEDKNQKIMTWILVLTVRRLLSLVAQSKKN